MGDAALMVCPAGLKFEPVTTRQLWRLPCIRRSMSPYTMHSGLASAHTLQDTYAALYIRRANASTLSSIECEQTIDSGARWRGVGRAMPPCTRPLRNYLKTGINMQ